MLAVHPVLQIMAFLIALYSLYLGIQRFRFLHLEQKAVFLWKRHVAAGMIGLGIMLFGLVGGAIMVRVYWHAFFITGVHGTVALAMAPLILFGLLSGVYMNSVKRRRKALPLVHGLNNLAVLALAFTQVVTGWSVYRDFVLGP
jgi:hypothetical protein